MCRYPFSSSDTKSKDILEIVHSDIAGPMETQSIGHARYFITFIDDFTKMVFVYFMKSKEEAFDKFKEFKNLVENHTGKQIKLLVGGDEEEEIVTNGKKVKTLRSDNGAEYLSKRFTNYCKDNGILQQLTNVYTPQQNGIAERMNRTLTEKARCLLFDADLPKTFWAEAVNMSAYIINKSVNSCSNKPPEELWTGKKVDLTKLEIFGSEVMVHIPKEKRKKWDPRAEKLIFVGYSNETKGYRCMNPKTRKLTLSRDVKFLNNPEKVILNLNESNDNNLKGNEIIELNEENYNDNNENGQDESIIVIDDSIYEEANDSSSYDETFNDSEKDPDYEPSEETLLEAENEETNDFGPRNKKNGR